MAKDRKRSHKDRGYSQAPRQREKEGQFLANSHFARVALGSREVLRLRPTWDRVADRLRHYSLARVLELLGRISLVLDTFSEFEDRIEGQTIILRSLVGEQSRVEAGLEGYLVHAAQQGHYPPWILFHERQLLNVAKAAFLALPPDHRAGSDNLMPFAEALLMVNNLIEGGSSSVAEHDLDSDAGRKEWEQYFFANLHSNSRGIELHEITRGYLLYHTSRIHLRDRDGTYIDIRDHLERITGMPADVFWSILTAINSYFQAADLNQSDRPYVFHPIQYLCGSGICTTDEVERFLKFFAIPAEVMKQEIEAQYSFENIQPYSILPLAKRPMILFGDFAIVPSVRLLYEKLVNGTHHLFLDPDLVPSWKERKCYLDYLGHIFEDYVEELLVRTYRHALGQYIPESILKKHIEGQFCDGIISVGDTVILVEAKAKLFPLATREWRAWDLYENKLRDIYVGSSRQIENTIVAIRSGRLAHLGIVPSKIRVYLPLVVTLDSSATNLFLHDRVVRMIAEEGLLQAKSVMPLQIMDVGELEIWETAVGIGKRMHRLLEQKASTPAAASMTFGNYAVSRGLHLGSRKNPYLAQVHDELTERAIRLFCTRQAEAGHIDDDDRP